MVDKVVFLLLFLLLNVVMLACAVKGGFCRLTTGFATRFEEVDSLR